VDSSPQRPTKRLLQRCLNLLLLTTFAASLLPPEPAFSAAGPRPAPLSNVRFDRSPWDAIGELLGLLGIRIEQPSSTVAGSEPAAAVGPGGHFGFSQQARLAQVTGTEVPGTGTPLPSREPTPTTPTPVLTVEPTPAGTPTVPATPSVGISPVPIYPSRGELIPGRVTPPPLEPPLRAEAGYRLLSVHSAPAAQSCTPPQVSVHPSGQVTLTAGGSGNQIRTVYFPRERYANAYVSSTSQAVSEEVLPATYFLNPFVSQLTLWISRVVPGQATTVPMVVTDNCREWETFAGAGTGSEITMSCLRVEAVPDGTQHNPPYIHAGTVGGVHTKTGSFSTSHTDVSIAGHGPTPQFTRAYNSNDLRPSPLGQGWTHNYAIHLARLPDASQDLVLVGPQGRSDRYTYTGGSYSPPLGVFTKLEAISGGWKVTNLGQSWLQFDSCGRLVTVVDPHVNGSTLSYNTATGRLSGVSDPAGRASAALTFDYHPNGRLWKVRDGLQRVVQLDYNASTGRLETVTDREGRATTYGYEGSSSRLTTITDARRPSPPCANVGCSPECPTTGCVVLTNAYYQDKRLQYQDDANGQRTTFVYRTDGTGSDITMPAPSYQPTTPTFFPTVSHTYNASGWLTTEATQPERNVTYTVTYRYDVYEGISNKGVRTSTTDARNARTDYCYDVDFWGGATGTRGLLTRVIGPSVSHTDGTARPTTLTGYDNANRPVRVYPPKGVNTTAVAPNCGTNFPAQNLLDEAFSTVNEYNAWNELTKVTQWFHDYDANGNRIGTTIADAHPAVTTYEYVETASEPRGLVRFVTPPRGNLPNQPPNHAFATEHSYYSQGDPQAGLRKSTKPPGQNAEYFCYDGVGRRVRRAIPPGASCAVGSDTNYHWTYTYDNEDRLTSTVSPPPDLNVPTTRLTSSSTYDRVGNRLTSTDAKGSITRYKYHPRGELQYLLNNSGRAPRAGVSRA
jgi:hypothetical protein